MKFLIFSILFFFSNCLFAQKLEPKTIHIANKGLPVEMRLLVESLQKNMDREKLNIFKETLQRLDSTFKRMSKEERFFVIKSEIYKILITKDKKRKIKISSFDPIILKNLDETLKKDKQTYSVFTKWYISAIRTDLKNLFDSNFFNRLINNKNTGRRNTQKEVKVLDKKLQLILPISEDILNLSAVQLESKIRDLMVDALEKIYHASKDLVTFSRFPFKTDKKSGKMQFFDSKEISPLDELPDNQVNKFMSTLKPDPSYKTPEFLPDPIDDWVPRSLPKAKVQPTPDPDYISPEELPSPVDDWLLGE